MIEKPVTRYVKFSNRSFVNRIEKNQNFLTDERAAFILIISLFGKFGRNLVSFSSSRTFRPSFTSLYALVKPRQASFPELITLTRHNVIPLPNGSLIKSRGKVDRSSHATILKQYIRFLDSRDIYIQRRRVRWFLRRRWGRGISYSSGHLLVYCRAQHTHTHTPSLVRSPSSSSF